MQLRTLAAAATLLALCGVPSFGQCSTATLATGVVRPNILTIDDTYVYFGDENGNVMRVAKTGGAVTTLATNPGLAMAGIAVDSTTVYYGVNKLGPGAAYILAGQSAVRSVPKNGGSSTTLASGLNAVEQVVADSTHIYWTSLGTQETSGIPHQDGAILRIPKSGGAAQTLVANLAAPVGLVMDDANVYYGENFGAFPLPAGPNGLSRVAKTGGAPAKLFSGRPVYAVAVDATSVYMTGGFEGSIFRSPKAGGAVDKTYATAQVFPDWIGVDGNQLFWVADGNCGGTGALVMADLTTGATTTLKGSMNCPFAGAIDASAVYVPTKNGGTIEKICRPGVSTPPPPPPPSSTTPSISAGGIVNASNYKSSPFAPGTLVTIFGANLGPSALVGLQLDTAGRVATSLGGTRVLVNGRAVPLVYASATQVSAILPVDLSGATATLAVEYQGVASAAATIPVGPSQPGLFTLNASGSGQGAILNQDFSVNGTANPAEKDSVIVLYGTGAGRTNPPGGDGDVTAGAAPVVAPYRVLIDGKQADVIYFGGAPGLVNGVFQANVKVPTSSASGNVGVIVEVNGVQSQTGVTLAVR